MLALKLLICVFGLIQTDGTIDRGYSSTEQLGALPESDDDRSPTAENVRTRSWIGGRDWIFGLPDQVVWVAGFVFYIAFRFFRHHRPHHDIGCVTGVSMGLIWFVLHVISGMAGDSTAMLMVVMTMAGFGYSAGAAGSWFKTSYDQHRLDRCDDEEEDVIKIPLSEQLAEMQMDLEYQLESIAKTSFDDETKEDLMETARMATVERMAQLLEADDTDG